MQYSSGRQRKKLSGFWDAKWFLIEQRRKANQSPSEILLDSRDISEADE